MNNTSSVLLLESTAESTEGGGYWRVWTNKLKKSVEGSFVRENVLHIQVMLVVNYRESQRSHQCHSACS